MEKTIIAIVRGAETKEIEILIEVIEEGHENSSEVIVSNYARLFTEECPGWSKDSEYSLMFLEAQQNYANELLRKRGHLFLNEVYDMLGIPRSKAGAVVGWVYDEKNPLGYNYVDFDIYNDRNRDFVNGKKKSILLDFNVDGCILDRI